MARDLYQKNLGGRPPKLTQELIDRICAYLRGGAYVHIAAAGCGVDKSTLERWLKRGGQKKKGLYAALCVAIAKACSEAELGLSNAIAASAMGQAPRYMKDKDGKLILDGKGHPVIERAAMVSDWRAASWLLERRHHQRWKSVQTIESAPPRPEGEQSREEKLKELAELERDLQLTSNE